MKRRHLYILAAIIWVIPGANITIKGICAYAEQPVKNIWWLLIITLIIMSVFFFIFRKVTTGYSGRIASLPEKVAPWHVFPLRGWLLLLFMAGLGMILGHIPSIPSSFIASFYSGLGPMLILASIRYIREMHGDNTGTMARKLSDKRSAGRR